MAPNPANRVGVSARRHRPDCAGADGGGDGTGAGSEAIEIEYRIRRAYNKKRPDAEAPGLSIARKSEVQRSYLEGCLQFQKELFDRLNNVVRR